MYILLLGEVIKPGDVKCVMNEGMPMYKNPFEKGRLIITFKLEFPKENWIDHALIDQVESLLPARQEVIIPDDAEECELTKFDPRSSSRQRHGEVYDDDDDEGMGGPRVQCASH